MQEPARRLTQTTALDRADAESLAELFRAVADPTRLQLLSLIMAAPSGELCVTDLTERLEFRQPTISHHLKLLVDAGLVRRERRGKQAWYSIAPERLAAIGDILR